MSVDTSAMHTSLFDPAVDRTPWVPPLDQILKTAREELDEHASANIHDRDAMLRAAVGLEMRLRQLIAALDKEASR
ncbi:hypothetical protein ABMX48_29385 [Streptomyces cavourensis]